MSRKQDSTEQEDEFQIMDQLNQKKLTGEWRILSEYKWRYKSTYSDGLLVLEIKKVQYSAISSEEEVIFPLPRKCFI